MKKFSLPWARKLSLIPVIRISKSYQFNQKPLKVALNFFWTVLFIIYFLYTCNSCTSTLVFTKNLMNNRCRKKFWWLANSLLGSCLFRDLTNIKVPSVVFLPLCILDHFLCVCTSKFCSTRRSNIFDQSWIMPSFSAYSMYFTKNITTISLIFLVVPNLLWPFF